jgi:hypothetical protein
MEQTVLSPFAAWESFYVIIGSSAAVLIGLQFVVMTLTADIDTRDDGSAVGAFATPTIVHFCAALFVAAVMSAPWPALLGADILLGVCGAVGVAYSVIVFIRARRQTGYVPVLEDWIWHNALPFLAYAILLVAAILFQAYPTPSLFVVGGTMLLLLFVGIHNSWDSIIYIAHQRRK